MTVAEIKEHLPAVEITEHGLERILLSIEAELNQMYGDNASITEYYDTNQSERSIYPRRKVLSVTEVKEVWWDTEYTLTPDDYVVIGGTRIDRKGSMFGDRVIVTYVPVDDSAQRDLVIVDLVKLELAYTGVDSEHIGDYSMSQADYEKRRHDILSRLEVRRWA